jgi:hypothetical protein
MPGPNSLNYGGDLTESLKGKAVNYLAKKTKTEQYENKLRNLWNYVDVNCRKTRYQLTDLVPDMWSFEFGFRTLKSSAFHFDSSRLPAQPSPFHYVLVSLKIEQIFFEMLVSHY